MRPKSDVAVQAILDTLAASDMHFVVGRTVAVIDKWLRDGEFSDANEFLRLLDPAKAHPAITLAVLAATYPARERLSERDALVQKAGRALPTLLGAERAERLLAPCR